MSTPSSPRTWALSNAQQSGSISPRGAGPLISGNHRTARKESDVQPPLLPSHPASPRPSHPPAVEDSEAELPDIVKRLFAELEVAYRTQKQVGTGKPEALRQALEDEVANQLEQVTEQTRLSEGQTELIRRAQNLHLEKLWFIFTATKQTRPDRPLADDADLAELLSELASPDAIHSEPPRKPSRIDVPMLPLGRPPSPSTSSSAASDFDSTPASVISGGGMARPVRGSAALRMSGTFISPQKIHPTSTAPSDMPQQRPVSPRTGVAQTGTIIVGRRISNAPVPAPVVRPVSPAPSLTQSQPLGSQLMALPALPPPPHTPPPPLPTMTKQDTSPPGVVALLAAGRKPALTAPPLHEVAKSRADSHENVTNASAAASRMRANSGVTIPGPPRSVPTNEAMHHTVLRTIRELREEPSRAKELTGNPHVQIMMAVLLLFATILMFRGVVSPSTPSGAIFPLPPLDPAVAALLDRLNYGVYKTLLTAHRIDWLSMNQLRAESLVAIGVPLGHAIRITDAVAEPLPLDMRNADTPLDGASAELVQSAVVSLISSDVSKTVQRLKTLLKDAGAEVRDMSRDTDAVLRASLPLATWRKALQGSLALSQYNHHRTNVQDVGAELKSKKSLLQLVETDVTVTKELLSQATTVADQLAARNQLRALAQQKDELTARIQQLQSGIAKSLLLVTVRPQDFSASGPQQSSSLSSLIHFLFNTPFFFVLALVGYAGYWIWTSARKKV